MGDEDAGDGGGLARLAPWRKGGDGTTGSSSGRSRTRNDDKRSGGKRSGGGGRRSSSRKKGSSSARRLKLANAAGGKLGGLGGGLSRDEVRDETGRVACVAECRTRQRAETGPLLSHWWTLACVAV